MRDTGLVTEILSCNEIKIIPLLKDTCLGCTSTTCAKQGKPFFVTNPKNLDIKVGSQAKITAPISQQILQALCSLFLPIGLSVTSYFLFAQFTTISQATIAGISISIFFSLCGLILFISQKVPLQKGEIAEIINYPTDFIKPIDCKENIKHRIKIEFQ